MKAEVMTEGFKAAPPVAVSVAATSQGWNGSDWIALGTGIYLLLQIAFLLWQWHQKKKQADRGDPI